MAKILSLRLNYKGKFLDYAKEGKEIKKQFFIGSNKFLHWQILDPSYPDKVLFIKKAGGAHVLQIPAGASFTCEKDGKPLDRNYLTQNKLLSGNQLILDTSLKGNINLHKDWDVDFDFREPWVPILTEEQRRIVAACAQRPALSSVDRFNRSLMIIATIIAIILMIVFDLFVKKDQQYELNLEDRLHTMQQLQKIETDKLDIGPSFDDQAAAEPEADAGAEAQTGTATGTAGGTAAKGSKGVAALLGGGGGGGSGSAGGSGGGVFAVTSIGGFSVGKGGGAGGGSGPGGGAGGAGGGGGAFQASGGPGFSSDVGAIAERGPAAAGYATRPAGSSGGFVVGDASQLAVSGKPYKTTARQQQVIQDYKRSNIQTVSESSIRAMDEATQVRYGTLGQQIRARQSQIEAAYRKAMMNQRMTLEITLFIQPNGQVQVADVVPRGAYPTSFLDEVKRICEGWKFNWNEKTAYGITINLNP